MRKLIVVFLCAAILMFGGALNSSAQISRERADLRRPLRPVHTFSIVARDPNTGELGVAVQSHWFSSPRNLSSTRLMDRWGCH